VYESGHGPRKGPSCALTDVNSEDEIWYAERLGAEKGIYEEWFFCVVWSLAETLDGIAKPGPVASTPLFAIGRIFQL
jgi:hypothetical protein